MRVSIAATLLLAMACAGDDPAGSEGGSSGEAGSGSTASNTAPGSSSVASSSAGDSSSTSDPESTSSGGSSEGESSTGPMPPLEPPPGEYGERAPLPEANSEMAVAELEGLVYVLGGYPASGETQNTVMVYDPASDSWEFSVPLPIAIHHPVAVGHEGLLYSLGGQTNTGDIDRTLVYDPGAQQWSDLVPMPTARGAGAAAVVDDTIYVVGGRPPAANAFQAYDVNSGQWAELDPLPMEYADRNHLAAVAIDGKVYVAGGRYDGGGFGSPMTDSLDIYDPDAGAWSQGAAMLRPRGGNNGVAAYGCFYSWGGEGSDIGEPNDVFPDHDVYDPIADAWTALAPLPTPVHGVTGAAFLDGLIYIPGGGTQSGGSSGSTIFQVYRPDTHCDMR